MSHSAATIPLEDTGSSRGGWRRFVLVLVPALLVVFFFAFAGRLLVTDNAQKSDVIVVFVGDSFDQYHWSIAAANDPTMFDVLWWRHREWAKTTLVEWTKWRGGIVSIAGAKGSFEALLPVTGSGPVEASRQFSGPFWGGNSPCPE